METMTAREAKNTLGEALQKAQHTPVQITKSGKPYAVLVSIESYRMAEEMKMQALKERIAHAEEEIKAGKFTDGENFMNDLIAGI